MSTEPKDERLELDSEDLRNLKDAARPRKSYALPRFTKDGEMVDAQWQSWKKLQRLRLANIIGDGEAEELEITGIGISVLAAQEGAAR